MERKDYYAILGVERGADNAIVARACRRLMQRYHPDICTDPQAVERFKEINEAGRVLRDAMQRAVYDRMIGAPAPKPAVRVRRQRHRAGVEVSHNAGGDIHVEAFLSARELLTGATIELTLWNSTLRIDVPANSRAGLTLRVGGRGLPRAQGNCGDLMVVVRDTDAIRRAMNYQRASGLIRRADMIRAHRTGRHIDISC